MAEIALTALTIAFKFVFYLASFQASGTALILIVFGSELTPQVALARKQMRRWAGICAFSAIGFVALICMALVRDLGVGGLDLLRDYLKTTGYGAALVTQLLACTAIAFGGMIAAVGAVFLLGSFALVGHVGPSFFANALVIHLIVGAMWLAILAPLRRMALMPENIADATRLGHSFSRLAQGFVPVSLVLGCVLAWSVSSSFAALIQTSYGLGLLGKIICSAGLIWAGAANKLRYLPDMAVGDRAAAARLARTVQFEWWLFIIILGTTATITTIMSPP